MTFSERQTMHDIKNIIHMNKDSLDKLVNKYKITLIVLFGSYAEGKVQEDSDIDIGIYLEDKISVKEETNLIEDMVHAFKRDNIDLVILNTASPVLRFEVVRNGKLLFERTPGDFLQFKLLSMKRYWEYPRFQKYSKMYMDKKEKRLSSV